MKPKALFVTIAGMAIASLFIAGNTQAQTALLLGELGAAAGSAIRGTVAEKAAAAAGGALAGGLIGNALEKKARRRDLEAYTLGRYQEAYIQAFSNWYTATLDPVTGRPPSFDGFWAADIGMPNQTLIQPQSKQVPLVRDAYEQTLALQHQEVQKNGGTAKPAATTLTTTRRKTINGVEYVAQQVIYPRLPVIRQ